MAIDDIDKVDMIALNEDEAVMIITDHLPWGEDLKDDEHMYLMQEKINSYLRFYESGEIYQAQPKTKDKKVIISLVSKYQPNEKGQWFIDQIQPIIESSGLQFRIEIK